MNRIKTITAAFLAVMLLVCHAYPAQADPQPDIKRDEPLQIMESRNYAYDYKTGTYQKMLEGEAPEIYNEYDDEKFANTSSDALSWIKSFEDDKYTARLGIDVSEYNGKIDWKKVKDAGVTFVFIRIGCRGYQSGKIVKDACFEDNYKGAKKQGLDIGVYFYSQAINVTEAIEEVKFIKKTLKDRELQLPVVFDPEFVDYDEARTDNVPYWQYMYYINAFWDLMAESDYIPCLYRNLRWEREVIDMAALAGLPIWYSDYNMYPLTDYAFQFWQYTNTGHVDGISGDVDMDLQFLAKN